MLKRLLLVVGMVLSACGPVEPAPKAGEACAPMEQDTCADQVTGLVCDRGAWVSVNCDGYTDLHTGAQVAGACFFTDPTRCVPPKPVVGDPCLERQEGGFGRCIDSTAQAKCVNGKWFACSCKPVNGGCRDKILDERRGLEGDCTPTDDLCWKL